MVAMHPRPAVNASLARGTSPLPIGFDAATGSNDGSPCLILATVTILAGRSGSSAIILGAADPLKQPVQR